MQPWQTSYICHTVSKITFDQFDPEAGAGADGGSILGWGGHFVGEKILPRDVRKTFYVCLFEMNMVFDTLNDKNNFFLNRRQIKSFFVVAK